jgi:hypothetical protein
MNRGWKFLLGLLLLAASLRAAEARMDYPAALRLFHEADAARPNDAFILQKISRQYSDLVDDQAGVEEKKRYAQTALEYARRAAALKPAAPVNVLSVVIRHGKPPCMATSGRKCCISVWCARTRSRRRSG